MKKSNKYKKIALALSLCLILLWAFMGTGASLAWFSDESQELRNIFHTAEFDLVVSHRLDNGDWEEVNASTVLFDDEALYEPGYVQVVYLKIENRGTIPFDFKTAVSVTDYTIATNVFGMPFNLQEHLLFGLEVADTEAEMDALVPDRVSAEQIADMNLNNYSTDTARLDAQDSAYMAIVVRMPSSEKNEVNYRGDIVPRVELGIIVDATQLKD